MGCKYQGSLQWTVLAVVVAFQVAMQVVAKNLHRTIMNRLD